MHRRSSVAGVLAFLVAILAATFAPASAGSCVTGVVQLEPIPRGDQSGCFASPPTQNSIKAICGGAIRVTVHRDIITLSPLSQASYIGGPALAAAPFNCQSYNATGLFLPGSRTEARVALYDDAGAPLSSLKQTAPNRLTLSPAAQYGGRAGPPGCTYNYTVISGCVLGIKAPAKPPACPSGYFLQSGAGKAKFCAPCPPGTSSKGPNAASCTPCPAGTSTRGLLAALCTPCAPTTFAPHPGAPACLPCSAGDNKFTDGRTCQPCPAGSFPDRLSQGRCVKCAAGRKCCTVGAGAGCPACKPGVKPTPATSTFALESATPAACLATPHALCAPALDITVGPDCHLTLSNRGHASPPTQGSPDHCPWRATFPMRGATPSIATDLTHFPGFEYHNHSLLAGTVTSTAPPHLAITIPATSCTLRYRALTKPLAALLGAPPRPSPPGACPRGQYRDTTTDTAPGPCLPCPPGTYASAPGACTPCKAGTYADTYGALTCTPCPRHQVSGQGAAACGFCDSLSYPEGGTTCQQCPPDSLNYFWDGGVGTCLGNAFGSVCCAAGACQQQGPRCSGPRRASSEEEQRYPAVLRVVSVASRSRACRTAALLKCLEAGDLVALTSVHWQPALALDVIGKLCPGEALPPRYNGGFAAPSRALVGSYSFRYNSSDAYELLSDPSENVITLHLSATPSADPTVASPAPSTIPACSATLRLVAGHTLDLTPPPAAACPPAGFIPTPVNGRTFCTPCTPGTFRPATATPTQKCTPCPAGTYSPINGAAACTPCPLGAYCPLGAAAATPCPPGSAAALPRQSQCTACPASTYSDRPSGATGCLPCAKGQWGPAGGVACGFPFAAHAAT